MMSSSLLVVSGLILLCSSKYYHAAAADGEGPTVVVSGGTLRGLEQQTLSGSTFYSFQGIPYARPPVGELRFKEPQPVDPWSVVLDATAPGLSCMQPPDNMVKMTLNTSEDCLLLNVYTQQLSGSRPVMVYIHGGGYMTGTGHAYRPDFLLDQGVLLVTINYRLGALGFLCWGDEALPSNLGLKDQVMALRWVQDNIAAFGGDPSRVTIIGESAGGSSVTFHMLSPASKGLFHGAVAMSGSALCPWAVSAQPKQRARRFVAALGLSEDQQGDPGKVADYLRTVDAEQFVSKAGEAFAPEDAGRPGMVPFAPCVDGSLLTDTPERLLSAGDFNKVPLMAGATSNEAKFLLVAAGLQDNEEKLKSFDENFKTLFGSALRVDDPDKKDVTAGKLRDFYFGDTAISKEQMNNLSHFMSDLYFVEPVEWTARAVSARSPPAVFLYLFSHEGQLSMLPPSMLYKGDSPVDGVPHTGDLPFVFPVRERGTLRLDPSNDDDRVRLYMTRLLANFASTGNPVPEKNDLISEEWTPFAENNRAYLDISSSLSLRKNLFEDRISFWRQMLPYLPKN